MNKKNIIILACSITVIIIISIIIVVVISNNKNSNEENSNTITEQTQEVEPPVKSKITQGQLPTSSLMSFLPSINIGTIGDVIETDAGMSVTVLNIELQDYQNYIALTQQNGFVNNIDTKSTVNTVLYSARNSNGIYLQTSYSTETKKMTLVVSKDE